MRASVEIGDKHTVAEALVCPKCTSEKMVPNARVMDRGQNNIDAGDLTVVVYEDPDALIFKGSHSAQLSARVCGDCGYTELFAEDPQELYEVYREYRDDEEEIESEE